MSGKKVISSHAVCTMYLLYCRQDVCFQFFSVAEGKGSNLVACQEVE